MKTRLAKGYTKALTLIELLVIIGVTVVLSAILLPWFARVHHPSSGINCVNNLHEITTALRVWEGDNGDKYPMCFARTNSEMMKLISNGRAYVLWQTMSNELNTPKVLLCPGDTKHTMPTNYFTMGFSDANISYFFNLDVSDETYPNMIVAGDDNLVVNGARVKPGILNLPTTGSLAWTKERHHGNGNITLADGSVQQYTVEELNSAIIAATNGAAVSYRLVIP